MECNNTITITFGDQAENHHGMQIIGELADKGFTYEELDCARNWFTERGCSCELISLDQTTQYKDAAILIIRKGVNALLADINKDVDKLYEEHQALHPDTKAFMYGRVVNKHARYNLCFDEKSQKPDYEEGKGTIISYVDVPLTKHIRERFNEFMGEKGKDLKGEGNYYYDTKKCGIGFHGDSERKKVIALRLGASMSLHYQWFYQSEPKGHRIQLMLNHGDLYIMGEKATGWDWKKRNLRTLRHAAGAEKFLKIQ
jgi:alkylated DNA repair dioxygenase AlkB